MTLTRRSKFDPADAGNSAFRVLFSFQYQETYGIRGLGPILGFLFVTALTIFFITSSDSATLAVDSIASGYTRKHWLSRAFWGLLEGCFAFAVLSSGGENALRALQGASIVAALPFNVVLLYLMQSILQFCSCSDTTDHFALLDTKRHVDCHSFEVPLYGGVLDLVDFLFSLGYTDSRDFVAPPSAYVIFFLKSIPAPFCGVYQILGCFDQGWNVVAVSCFYGVSFISFLCCGIAFLAGYRGLAPWCLASLLVSGVTLGLVRRRFRKRFNIQSNVVADCLGSIIFWPQVVAQLRHQCLNLPKRKVDGDDVLDKIAFGSERSSAGLPVDDSETTRHNQHSNKLAPFHYNVRKLLLHEDPNEECV